MTDTFARFRAFFAFACLLLIAGAAACSGDDRGGNPIKPVIVTTPVTISITITGQSVNNLTLQLTAVANLSNGTSRNVTTEAAWRSSNTAVAAVTETGVVTAVGTGQAQITATYDGVTGSFGVNVNLTP
jgi:hypothetical protein